MTEDSVYIKNSIRSYFREITLKTVRENLKTFKGLSTQQIYSSQVSSSVYAGIQKMKDSQVGHLIVTEHADISSTVGIISKKDILVFMIKNFTTDAHIDVLLDEKIQNIDIGTKGADVMTVNKHETLRRVLQEMLRHKLSCVPIIDDQRKFYGVINKHHIELLFKECCLHFVACYYVQLDLKVFDLLEYVKQRKLLSDVETKVVYPSDTLRDVVQKFLLNKGQNIYLDENDCLIGTVSINDIINYLL